MDVGEEGVFNGSEDGARVKLSDTTEDGREIELAEVLSQCLSVVEATETERRLTRSKGS